MTSTQEQIDTISHFQRLIEETGLVQKSKETSAFEISQVFFGLVHKLALDTTKINQTRSTPEEDVDDSLFTRISPRFEPIENNMPQFPTDLDKFIMGLRLKVTESSADSIDGQKLFICHSSVLSFQMVCHSSCHGSRGRR